jgi:hypothetical protein
MIAAQSTFQRILTARLSAYCAFKMLPVMLSVPVQVGKKKIFNSIVRFISIDVMHHFVRFKIAANLFFHNQSVFVNSAVGSCVRMIPYKNGDVSMRRGSFSSFETRMKLWPFFAEFHIALPAALDGLSIVLSNVFSTIVTCCSWVGFCAHINIMPNCATKVKE